jgi:GT2 family glycosyltransferase
LTVVTSEGPGLDTSFGKRGASIGVQSILFNNDHQHVERSIGALARAAELAISTGACSRVTLSYGDCSPQRCLSTTLFEQLRSRYDGLLKIDYKFFGENRGSARGHNELAAANDSEFFLFQNPDVIVSPRLLEVMLSSFDSVGVGMVEAKQLPIEHPKEYDQQTGETAWAATACAMVPALLFNQLQGFDSHSFFLYCDDVDFSWRVRRVGFRVVFQPSAVVFHDKRLSDDAAWLPTNAEKYYSAEAALFLTYKWSRNDLTEKYLAFFKDSGIDYLVRASQEFQKRQERGDLPEPVDENHKVGQFFGEHYTKHRFSL